MKILHYSLGLPPYRTGGLTKYNIDLMIAQAKQGNDVSLLFPGHYSFKAKSPKIKINNNYNGIDVYELVNPLPVPLLGGVSVPKLFTVNSDKNIYLTYLRNLKPDVVHVHTLMGLHKEFIEAAKDLNIKIYFTSHDYYGICPKVNLLNLEGKNCEDFKNGEECVACNENSYSIKMIHIMQSRYYKLFKDNILIKKLRQVKKQTYNIQGKAVNSFKYSNKSSLEYSKLRRYYLDLLSSFDKIHFNSNLSKDIYEQYVGKVKGEVISISHRNIKDRRKKRKYGSNDVLKITYLGPTEGYKGIFLLIDSLNKLKDQGITNWELNVYGDDKSIPEHLKNENIKVHGRYTYEKLEKILNNTDLIVVPSIWNETFGFITLEAISYGVPTIVTKNVGAKDLISNGESYIVEPNSEALSECIKKIILDRKILSNMNSNICKGEFLFDMDTHTKEINKFYVR